MADSSWPAAQISPIKNNHSLRLSCCRPNYSFHSPRRQAFLSDQTVSPMSTRLLNGPTEPGCHPCLSHCASLFTIQPDAHMLGCRYTLVSIATDIDWLVCPTKG